MTVAATEANPNTLWPHQLRRLFHRLHVAHTAPPLLVAHQCRQEVAPGRTSHRVSANIVPATDDTPACGQCCRHFFSVLNPATGARKRAPRRKSVRMDTCGRAVPVPATGWAGAPWIGALGLDKAGYCALPRGRAAECSHHSPALRTASLQLRCTGSIIQQLHRCGRTCKSRRMHCAFQLRPSAPILLREVAVCGCAVGGVMR